MPGDDEYELLPHEEVEQLRKDVNKLKKNPLGEGKDSKDLIVAINDLKHAILSLHALFAQTNHEMERDYHATSIKEHFHILSQQNERIAEGIVSAINLLKTDNQQQTTTTPSQQPLQQSSQEPQQFQEPLAPSQPAGQSSQQFSQQSPHQSSQQPLQQPAHNLQQSPVQKRAAQETQDTIGTSLSSPSDTAQTTQQPMQESMQQPPQQPIPPLPPPPKKKGLFR